jgi:hypothetical protein
MPWNVIIAVGAVALIVVGWISRRRRPPSSLDGIPHVGQPPADARPIVEPRLEDIGWGSYELPLPENGADE